MKLFILKLIKNWPAGYDCNCQMIVRAKDESQARNIAQDQTNGDEKICNPDCWTNKDVSSCRELTVSDHAGILITSPFVMLDGDEND